MSRGRAYMHGDIAYRARINYTNREGQASQLILGPYSTPGAARGQATSKIGSRYSGMMDATATIEKATYWERVL